MMKPEVVIVGSANMDLTVYASRLPHKGETMYGSDFKTSFGGKGANQAIQAARLHPQEERSKVAIICKVGNDQFGNEFLKHFKDQGMDIRCGLTATTHTGVAHITVAEDGENVIIIVKGANHELKAEELHQEPMKSVIQNAKVVLCQNEIQPGTTLEAFRIAKSAPIPPTTIFSPAPADATLPNEIFELSDVVILNEGEAKQMLQIELTGYKEAAQRFMKEKKCRSTIITLGKDGCYFLSGAKSEGTHVPGIRVDNVVDTVGAGDSFAGSLGFFLSRANGMEDAIRRATEIAAISVQSKGASTSYPVREKLPAHIFA